MVMHTSTSKIMDGNGPTIHAGREDTPTNGSSGQILESMRCEGTEGAAGVESDENDNRSAGPVGVPSSANATPYQIFRSAAGAASPEGGSGCQDSIRGAGGGDESEAKEEDASSDAEEDDEEEDEGEDQNKENTVTFNKSDADHKPIQSVTTSSANGLLSPDSIEIRENARRLLLQQPRNKRNTRRRSLQPLSLASFMNSGNHGDGGIGPQANPDSNVHDKFQVEQEIEANFGEVKEAAKAVASRAVEAGGEAIEAFELGLEALSTEVATKARRARRSLSAFGQGLVWD